MVSLDPIVGIAVGSMPGRREQLLEHCRVHRRVVGDHLDWRDRIVPMARWKNLRVPFVSRRAETNTSMTWPNWSIAR
jgi:hypothetical protein